MATRAEHAITALRPAVGRLVRQEQRHGAG
jgi:hypothetical protein